MVEHLLVRKARVICVAILFAVTANLSAQTQLDIFVAQLQRASQGNDRTAIAAMVRYPLMISVGGIRIPIPDSATFLARYDDIFTPELRGEIARRTDAVVIQQVDGELRITSIAVPAPTAAPDAVATVPVDAISSGVVRKPDTRRIAIRVGPRPTQIPGTLLRDSVDTFVVYLPKGKLASVRLERVPSGAAAIRVVHARTGAPLSARISADARFVSGRSTENGDYRIEVRRLGADEGHLPYMLSLSLR